MLRLVVLFVQLILASSPINHTGTNAASPRLKPPPAPRADSGGGNDPWGSSLKPPPAPAGDSGGGYDPWG